MHFVRGNFDCLDLKFLNFFVVHFLNLDDLYGQKLS